jgi:hypothetical protein
MVYVYKAQMGGEGSQDGRMLASVTMLRVMRGSAVLGNGQQLGDASRYSTLVEV